MEGTRLQTSGSAQAKREAIQKWAEALPLWRALEDHYEEALILTSLAGVHYTLGEKQKALDYLN
jgi:hypothetical protein